MLPQAADFRAEADALHALLVTLNDADWERATQFKGWTVNDIVQHLHDGDQMAAASVEGPDQFAAFRAERQALIDTGLTRVQAARRRLGDLTGTRLLARWHACVADLCDKLSAMPSDARLKWAGPDMGVRMFTTARQMETWAHGQAIYDLMDVVRTPTDRLRNIVEIGVRTYGWTFANRKLAVPGPVPYVRLNAASGAIWEWNDHTPDNAVEGEGLAFCQVVTQVRNVTDTNLRVTGEPARIWMKVTPVMPMKLSSATLSTFTGVSAAILMRATTRLGSSGSSRRVCTSPTLMPLKRTSPPSVRPLTAPSKRTLYTE